MIRSLTRPLLAAIAAVALVTTGHVPAAFATTQSGVQDFTFESFSAEYFLSLDESGYVETRVVETIVAVFPEFDQNRGIVRSIPTHHNDYPLDVHMVSVTDEAGDPVYFEREDYSDSDGLVDFPLGTDDFVHGEQTYVLEYEMRNTIRHFADAGADEFYWDINGTGWPQPFEVVDATIHLTGELAEALNGDVACYQGAFGGTDSCELVANADGTEFTVTAGPLGPYSTVTVAIGFEPGTATQPTLLKDSWIFAIAPILLLGVLVAALLAAIVVRLFVWRDARGTGTIVAQYGRPERIDIVLAAEIIGKSRRAFPALLIDFAVRRILHIVETHPTAPHKERYALEFVSDDDLIVRESDWLKILFPGKRKPGKRVKPGTFSNAVGAKLHSKLKATPQRAVGEGYRQLPDSRVDIVLRRVATWGMVAFVLLWIAAAVAGVLEDTPIIGASLLGALAWLVIGLVLIKPKVLTEKGAIVRDHLKGIREYLTIAEEDRIRMLQGPDTAERRAPLDPPDPAAVVKLYERLLPFAVLWGIEDKWIDHLRGFYPAGTPDWIEGASLDSGMIHSFSRATTAAVRPLPTPRSSGSGGSSSFSSFSGGSSGGGFSGGGGGGGGGGGR